MTPRLISNGPGQPIPIAGKLIGGNVGFRQCRFDRQLNTFKARFLPFASFGFLSASTCRLKVFVKHDRIHFRATQVKTDPVLFLFFHFSGDSVDDKVIQRARTIRQLLDRHTS